MARKLNCEKLTLDWLREEGYHADYAGGKRGKMSHDPFGWIDILAFDDESTVAVQATSVNNMSARRKKILASDDAAEWVRESYEGMDRIIKLVGWKRGKNRGDYERRVELIRPADFDAHAAVEG